MGTGINTAPGFDKEVAEEIARITGMPFVTAPIKFTVQGSISVLTLPFKLFKGLKIIVPKFIKGDFIFKLISQVIKIFFVKTFRI
ncbi:MAG: hypothetical protein K8E24_000290 [Methanobacterium paludis]|nr:hypothetical protein [Methanobacterium paludis]